MINRGKAICRETTSVKQDTFLISVPLGNAKLYIKFEMQFNNSSNGDLCEGL